ncbi:hypothetical protein LTR78_009016, partial [Recurvomyces mirabilis]
TYDSLTTSPDCDDTKTLAGSISHSLSPSSIAQSGSYAPSTSATARSTLDSYAASSIIEQRSLVPGHHHRQSSVDLQSQRTPARKAFVGLCHAVNVVIPVDVDDGATSMQASSLAKVFQRNGPKFNDDTAAASENSVQGRRKGG